VSDGAQTVDVFEIDIEHDEGFRLDFDSGETERWRGLRVRYRPLGSRGRWSKFLLDIDEGTPSTEQLQEVCRLHAERDRG
jgi:hypothetical protein